MLWHQLSERVLQGKQISREEALQVLAVPQEELLELISACYRVRRHYHGQKIKLNMLINAKSGLCAEDCSYCSQSIVSKTGVERYPLQSREVLLEGARNSRPYAWRPAQLSTSTFISRY